MKKVALIGAFCLAGALVPSAFAASGPKTITLEVTSVGISVVDHDKAPKGASRGDTIVYHDKLLNAVAQFGKAKGATVGSDHGTMTFTSPHAARFEGLAQLPGGTLTLDGKVTAVSSNLLTIPVTSGTGAYAGATGVLVIGPGSKRALNIYRLQIAVGNVA
jgi:Dirigent-like protein